MLEDRFQAAVDAVAMLEGSTGTDAYLDGWEWGQPFTMEGTARECAEATVNRFNRGMPKDFVSRIRNLHRAGNRTPQCGAIDGWIQDG